MIVTCIEAQRCKLPTWHYAYIEQQGPEFAYSFLEIGKRYLICGIILFAEGASYLIQAADEPDAAFEAPWQMFSIRISPTPTTWFIGERETAFGKVPIIGYEELVSDPKHMDGILENNQKHIEIFIQRANELRSQMED